MNGIGMNHAWIKFLPDFIKVKIEGRYTLQQIVGNTGWLFADKIVRMGVGVIVGAWVARYLGPAQFGTYSYALAFVTLFGPLATLGLDNIVVRNIVRDPSGADDALGTTFVLKFIGGVSALFLSIAAVSVLHPQDVLTRWLVGLTAVGMIFQAFDTIDFWFQSQVQSQYSVYSRNAAFLIVSLAKVVLILSRAPLIAFAAAGLTEIIIGAFGLLACYRLNHRYLKLRRASISRARELLKDSWPLILSGLSIIVYMRIDQVMLGEMIGSAAVGKYTVAVKLSEVWYFIPTAIVSSVFPSIVRLRMENETLYYARLQKLFNTMTMISMFIALPMTFFSTSVVTLIYGDSFHAAGPVLAVHIWTAVFVFLGVAQSPWDASENLTKLSLARTASGALLNITLNVFFIPRFSIIGAAVSTIISQAFSAVLLNCISKKTRVIFFKQVQSFFFFRYAFSSRKSV